MSDNSAYPRLCSTCKHTATCNYVKAARRPSFYCEEFEIEIVDVEAPAGRRPIAPLAHPVLTNLSNGLIGLCSDCENHAKCVFPKPEGGVWHCEEYR